MVDKLLTMPPQSRNLTCRFGHDDYYVIIVVLLLLFIIIYGVIILLLASLYGVLLLLFMKWQKCGTATMVWMHTIVKQK